MFIREPDLTPDRRRLYDEELEDEGYIKHSIRAWAWLPNVLIGLFELMGQAEEAGNLSYRDKGVLVTAAASGLGDASCSLGWGARLARATDAGTAAAVLRGEPADRLTPRELAMADYARQLAVDANATTQQAIDRMRDAGLDDGEIFAITAYVALRIAFSTVNDGIGTPPDLQLIEAAPTEVAEAVSFGRQPG